MAAKSTHSVDATEDASRHMPSKAGSETQTPETGRASAPGAAAGAPAGVPPATKHGHTPWKRRAAAFWTGGAAAVITGALCIWLGGLLSSVADPPASPPAPSTAAIINPGHLPGRLDVSTMSPGHRFYAVPNFYEFQSCGRPCWLPLYQLPTLQSARVTDGWPCEYYGPNPSSEPSCTKPPATRARSQMADPVVMNSGDRLLVVCQVTQIGNGRPAETISNSVEQSSNIWDMVAVPASYISPDSPAQGLAQVPDMPGFYEAFAPDMWLGDTGSHDIPCS
jgi:hypothetical protein